jgi:hypothetical protein
VRQPVRAGLGVAVIAAAVLAGLGGGRPGVEQQPAVAAVAPTPADPAALLARRCDAAMGAGTCAVMNADAAPVAGERVFVAGLGEVDGALYAQLRIDGATMCARVQQHCREAWDGTPCRLARALYDGMAPMVQSVPAAN